MPPSGHAQHPYGEALRGAAQFYSPQQLQDTGDRIATSGTGASDRCCRLLRRVSDWPGPLFEHLDSLGSAIWSTEVAKGPISRLTGRGHSSSPSIPWGSAIWSTEAAKGPPSPLNEWKFRVDPLDRLEQDIPLHRAVRFTSTLPSISSRLFG
ncbi:MAG: hypothetical protein Q9215_005897 [Flavoplaca cf. flavocitrina]